MTDQAEKTAGGFWADIDGERALDRYAALVNMVDDGIYQLDEEGRFVAVNDTIVELTGYSREEILDEDASLVLPDDDVSRIQREIERRLAADDRRDGPIEFTARTADGETIPCELDLHLLVEDGAFRGTIGVVHEITERKRTRQQLREERDMFAEGPAIVFRWKPDEAEGWPVEYVSENVEDVLGYVPEELESGEIPYADLLFDEEIDRIAAEVAEHRDGTTERFSHEPYRVRTDDGDVKWVKDTTKIVRDDSGEIANYLGYLVDITERKERERELQRYETIVETVNDGIYVKDADGRFTMVNEAYAELTGYDREELVGEHASLVVDESAIQQSREVLGTTADEGADTPVLEAELRTANGDRAPTEGTFATLETGDGEPEEIGVVRDIAERKEREQELQESKNQLRALIDVLPVAVFVAEADGEIVEWNEAAEAVWGGEVAESESVAEYEEYDAWWADTGEPVEPGEWPLARALEGEEVTDPDEIRIRGFDGEYRTVLNHGMPVRDADGEVSRAVVTLVDITERKEYQRKLEESNERLRQFAYAASHDLQEPLRMVSSYLQLIEDRYAEELDEDGREFLEFAVDGSDRMREMIDGLLSYSRVETRDEPLEPADLDAVLDDALTDLQVRVGESGAEIAREPLPTVEGDANQLRQVFQNLLQNAIEYSGDDPPRVSVSAERDGPEWVVTVRDDGIGIDSDNQDRIFEVFQRLHTNDEHAGTGIGLALCERIVDRHGGDIWVDSEPGEGATFYFTVPATEK